MSLYLIYYGIRAESGYYDDHFYGTVKANNPQHAIQLAVAWIPGIKDIDVRGIISREIGNN